MSCDRVAFARWLALVGGIALAGCTPNICGRNSDCASGLICTTVGACIVPPVDASTDDAAAPTEADAASTSIRDADGDAFAIEPIDAAPDAAPIDAASADANLIDAPPDNGLTHPTFEGVW